MWVLLLVIGVLFFYLLITDFQRKKYYNSVVKVNNENFDTSRQYELLVNFLKNTRKLHKSYINNMICYAKKIKFEENEELYYVAVHIKTVRLIVCTSLQSYVVGLDSVTTNKLDNVYETRIRDRGLTIYHFFDGDRKYKVDVRKVFNNKFETKVKIRDTLLSDLIDISKEYRVWESVYISDEKLVIINEDVLLHVEKNVVLKKIKIDDLQGCKVDIVTKGSKGGLGMAALGGITFGGFGAVAGSNIGMKKSIISKMTLYLKINDFNDPIYELIFAQGTIPSDSGVYGYIYKQIQEVAAAIDIIQNKKKNENQTRTSNNDIVEELKSMKELLDLNIITSEEFEAKKKSLLKI